MPLETIRKVLSEDFRLQKNLDVEAALAKAEAAVGVIPREAAEEIQRKAHLELIDRNLLKEETERVGHPFIALVNTLARICEGNAGEYVHWGATSHDIADTTQVLQLKEVHQVVLQTLREIQGYIMEMAEKHADTVMVGRTIGQHALPITFGYKVAIWLREVSRHIKRMEECRKRLLVGQLSGGVGTMASLSKAGPKIQKLFLRELGLEVPDICWHTARDSRAEFMCILAMIGSILGKIANEIYTLQQTETAELEEGSSASHYSSTMPHKRNPSDSQRVVTLSKVVCHNASLALEAMIVEHERDLRASAMEDTARTQICISLGEMLQRSLNIIRDLIVKPDRMQSNLGILKGAVLSEAVTLELGKRVGRLTAHQIVREASLRAYDQDISFKEALMEDSRVTRHIGRAKIDRLLDPRNYVGLAPKMARDMVALTKKERHKYNVD